MKLEFNGNVDPVSSTPVWTGERLAQTWKSSRVTTTACAPTRSKVAITCCPSSLTGFLLVAHHITSGNLVQKSYASQPPLRLHS